MLPHVVINIILEVIHTSFFFEKKTFSVLSKRNYEIFVKTNKSFVFILHEKL